MTLGSTQARTEMSARNLPGGKGWPRRLTTLWAFMACYRDSFTFICLLLLKPPGPIFVWEENGEKSFS
jgi:hypothetical protein